jgi:hypothetical protein
VLAKGTQRLMYHACVQGEMRASAEYAGAGEP